MTQQRIEAEWENNCALLMWSDEYGGNLFIAKTRVEDDFDTSYLSKIREIPDLKVLILRWTTLRDGDLSELCIRDLNSLEILALDNTLITSEGLKSIEQLPGLKILRLQNTSVGDDSVPVLRHLSLSLLDIRNTNITAKGVQELKRCLPHTQILVGVDQEKVTNDETEDDGEEKGTEVVSEYD